MRTNGLARQWPQGYVWDPKSGFVNLLVPNGSIASFDTINNLGEIGGYIDSLNPGIRLAAIWTSPQNYVVLPPLGNNGAEVLGLNDSGQAIGDSGDYPAAINDQGQIVGFMGDSIPGDPGLATLWDNGQLYDLNNFIPANSGWVLQQAYAINDLGQIAGIGTYDGNSVGFLLTPIPEPAEFFLVIGFSLLFAPHRKNSRL